MTKEMVTFGAHHRQWVGRIHEARYRRGWRFCRRIISYWVAGSGHCMVVVWNTDPIEVPVRRVQIDAILTKEEGNDHA